MGSRASCRCRSCVACCHHKPGNFLPGEMERVAEYLGMDLAECFDQLLAAEEVYIALDKPPVFVPLPAVEGQHTHTGGPLGTCIFLRKGRCAIHAVKPYECREALHGQTDGEIIARGERIANAWAAHQDQVRALLGIAAVPKPEYPDLFASAEEERSFFAWLEKE